MLSRQLNGSPAGLVLALLQRRGAATVRDLQKTLGVTATAVRQQISGLAAEGYVQQTAQRSGRGRPRHVYSLTAAGRALFPHHYDEFTSELLREIVVTEGPAKVQALLARMGQRLAEQYAVQIAVLSPAERAGAFAKLLNAKGIMAEVELAPEGILVNEFTCPYYELAREHRAICDMEQDMMAYVIRQPVELVSCTLDGHHGCQFRVGK
jgi:predicted ArsR family transcriptional regulator